MARTRVWRRGITHDLRQPKHLKPIPAHLRINRAFTDGVTPDATASSTMLLKSFPMELITQIFGLVFLESTEIRSWTYTFIPIRAMLAHALPQVCSLWREMYLRGMLSSRSNRGGRYLGLTTQEVAVIREWFPDVELRGCLLILGDPNSLLLETTDSQYALSAIISDSSFLNAVEVVEWAEASIGKYSDVGQPPDIEPHLLEVCERHAASMIILDDSIDSNHQGFQGLVTREIFRLALHLCSKVLETLSLCPNLKTTELPVWTLLLPSIDEGHAFKNMWAAQYSTVHCQGGSLVSTEELKRRVSGFVKGIRGLNLVGYPLGLFGVFLRETQTPRLRRFLDPPKILLQGNSAVENRIRRCFEGVNLQDPFFHNLFDHLEDLSWRDICRYELLSYKADVKSLFFKSYKGKPALKGFYATDHIMFGYETNEPLAMLSTPLLGSSTRSLKCLTICLVGSELEVTLNAHPWPFHHCNLISRFAELLPAIEYLNLTVPTLCDHAFEGASVPQTRCGTFVVSVISQYGRYRLCTDKCMTSEAVLSHFQAAQAHFSAMENWDVQIRFDEIERGQRGCAPRSHLVELPKSLIALPIEGTLLFSKLRKEWCSEGVYRWELSYDCVEPVPISSFESWVKDGNKDQLWTEFPCIVTNSERDDEEEEGE